MTKIGTDIKPKNKVAITVESIQELDNGIVKVKIKEPNLALIDIQHEGRKFVTLRDYGRGRYTMREVILQEQKDRIREWEELK